ncbi:hypothetical protein ACFLXL_00210 [Chloroflexota bacterium]
MFDKTLRELRRLKDGVRVSVNLPLDEKNYLDRRCPAEVCAAYFKVLFEDWLNLVRDEIVYCPICRYKAGSSEWNTEEQAQYIKNVGLGYVTRTIGNALSQDAQSFNRCQGKKGFVQMTMSFKPGANIVIMPIEAADAMEQSFVCAACGCRYASLGAAFFCPACGYNSAITIFDNSVETILRMISSVEDIRIALRKSFDVDIAENSIHQIIESSFCKLVSSFERFAEASFERLPNEAQFIMRKNVFQNLGESSRLWQQAIGKCYKDMLTKNELADLNRLFQQRHLLTHTEGVVDEEYIIKTNDKTYSVGQRLVIRETSVRQLAGLIAKLSSQLKQYTHQS